MKSKQHENYGLLSYIVKKYGWHMRQKQSGSIGMRGRRKNEVWETWWNLALSFLSFKLL